MTAHGRCLCCVTHDRPWNNKQTNARTNENNRPPVAIASCSSATALPDPCSSLSAPTRRWASIKAATKPCHVLFTIHNPHDQWGDPRYLAWAEDAADVVWARGLLRKGNGLCHGVAGNAYCECVCSSHLRTYARSFPSHTHTHTGFLSCYRATGNDRFLHRARQFALAAEEPQVTGSKERSYRFAIYQMGDRLHTSTLPYYITAQQGTPDHPWSLYEGHAGLLSLYTDLVVNPHPSTARLPGFEMMG